MPLYRWFSSASNSSYLPDSVSEKTNDNQLEVANANEKSFAPAVYSTSEDVVAQLRKPSVCAYNVC